jgi:hypothetical protein
LFQCKSKIATTLYIRDNSIKNLTILVYNLLNSTSHNSKFHHFWSKEVKLRLKKLALKLIIRHKTVLSASICKFPQKMTPVVDKGDPRLYPGTKKTLLITGHYGKSVTFHCLFTRKL